MYMLTGNQWWLFKFSERLNILWLEEPQVMMKVLRFSVAAITIKIFIKHYFTISKRILLLLAVKVRKEWREKCVLVLKVWQGSKKTWRGDKFLLYVPCCKQTQKREQDGYFKSQHQETSLIMPIGLLYT